MKKKDDLKLQEIKKKELTQVHDNRKYQEHGWNEGELPCQVLDSINQNPQS
ncbi:hypothetical protein Hanom_Chr05g00438091 [Helianthus anomalus]